jgi:hypothetical protein
MQRQWFSNFILGAPSAQQICQQMESGGIHLRQGLVSGTFIATLLTPPPTVTATTLLGFQLSNISLSLYFNQLLKYIQLWIR